MKLIKWRGIVARAKKRGKFTPHENKLAMDWPTCAVGERHHAIGYDFLQQILSEENALGCYFADAVEHTAFDAKEITRDASLRKLGLWIEHLPNKEVSLLAVSQILARHKV